MVRYTATSGSDTDEIEVKYYQDLTNKITVNSVTEVKAEKK